MKKIIFSLLLGALASSNAFAVVIDFTGFSNGDTGSTTLVTPEATFNSFGGNFFVGAAGLGSEICALGSGCATDFEAIFTSEVDNLSFVTSGYNPGDTVQVFAYDISNALLGSVTKAANGLVDLSAFSGISKLFFDDSSTGAGFGYDAFTFDYATTNSNNVPEPGSLALFALGLAGLGFSKKKKMA